MSSRVPVVVLCGSLLLGSVPGAAAQVSSGVRVRVVTPRAEMRFGGLPSGRTVARRATTGRVIPVLVVVPLLGRTTTQPCLEAHVLSRLARMTEAGATMQGDLSAGRSLLCSGFHGRLERWPNGERATSLTNAWFYPNGERAHGQVGSWFYPDGTRARALTDTWYYPSGKRARSFGGTWFTPDGQRIGKLDRPTGPLVTVSILEQLWRSL
ncbi:MAG: hypothetical protein ACOC9T_01300 [Myxococcota bacterium]